MRDRIPFVGSLSMEIDRNLFGATHVNVSWWQQSSVIRKAPTHDSAQVQVMIQQIWAAVCGSYPVRIFARNFYILTKVFHVLNQTLHNNDQIGQRSLLQNFYLLIFLYHLTTPFKNIITITLNIVIKCTSYQLHRNMYRLRNQNYVIKSHKNK